MYVRQSTRQQPSEPDADIAWVVALLPDPEGRPRVLHPQGVSPLPDAGCTVMLCSTCRVNDTVVTWAFGYVNADSPSPAVAFLGRHGRAHPGYVRRLTTTTWAAQRSGRWTRIRVA